MDRNGFGIRGNWTIQISSSISLCTCPPPVTINKFENRKLNDRKSHSYHNRMGNALSFRFDGNWIRMFFRVQITFTNRYECSIMVTEKSYINHSLWIGGHCFGRPVRKSFQFSPDEYVRSGANFDKPIRFAGVRIVVTLVACVNVVDLLLADFENRFGDCKKFYVTWWKLWFGVFENSIDGVLRKNFTYDCNVCNNCVESNGSRSKMNESIDIVYRRFSVPSIWSPSIGLYFLNHSEWPTILTETEITIQQSQNSISPSQ